MPDRRTVLTPEALLMIDTIARSGSFAAAARELGKVPSALTYSVRQLEEALDVLLFDRSSRQARFTAAGEELLHEGRRLLQATATVANRSAREGSQVVQVYLAPTGDRTGDEPAQRLVGFARVAVPAGGTATVDIALDARCYDTWDPDGHDWIPAGTRFELRVGRSSRQPDHVLTVTAP